MTRVALLGATGSIGRQAIEIVEAHPELELCAAASGSTPLDDIDAPLKQVGGDLTELLDRAEPDVVLNAVVGFAGIHATLWALERGVDLALANKESLVAAGPLALAAQQRGGGRILPVDSEHSALFQCLEGRSGEQIDTLVLTGSGGAQGWLDIQRPGITVCKDDQGLAVDLALEADTAQMQRWLIGLVPFRDLVADGHARFLGPSRLAKAFPTWFDTTVYSRNLRRGEQRRLRDAVPA